jgi:predicted DsbA family dithiol-disulfide isomerase
VEAVVWSDYLCPWAYLGRDRTRHLRGLGVTVTVLPFDLHPELPPQGRRVAPNGRLADVYRYIAGECAAVGLPFVAPTHVPNTRKALQAAVLVRHGCPEAFDALDDALFEAVFVHGRDLGDPAVLDDLVATSGADAADVRAALDAGTAAEAVAASTAAARERGVTGTPSWLLGGTLLVPGVQPREAFDRWVSRLQARQAAGEAPSPPS